MNLALSLGFPSHSINLSQYDLPAFQGHKSGGGSKRLSLPIVFSFVGLLTIVFFTVCIIISLWISKNRNSPSGAGDNIEQPNRRESEDMSRGVEQATVDSFPVIVFVSAEETSLTYRIDSCPICNEDFVLQDRLMVLPSCRHTFHVVCITRHMTMNDTCPYCRQLITSTMYGNEV